MRRDFKALIDRGAFVEWAKVHGNYYGTAKKEIDRILNAGKIPIFDVDVQGARALREQPGQRGLHFYRASLPGGA